MSNAYDVVRQFEKKVADYAGAPYAVSVESCSAALFLCCKYLKVKTVEIPKFTYPSVANQILHAGGKVRFRDEEWQHRGWYWLNPYSIIDSAKYMAKGMYKKGKYICLSFHLKKVIPIGRGGMILTDSKKAVEWFKLARFDGRHERDLENDTLAFPGWNIYMTPEQAARGLEFMQWIDGSVKIKPDPYQNLSKYEFFTS